MRNIGFFSVHGLVCGLTVGGLVAAIAAPAAASCLIKNETGYAFTVASGNVANQRIGAHATTTIAPGKVQGRTEEGKTISGVCKDGSNLLIKEKNGVPLLGTPAVTPNKKKAKGATVRAPAR
jgi:hypothetical protein